MKITLWFDGGIKISNPGGLPVFGYHASQFTKLDDVTTSCGILIKGYGVVINAPSQYCTNNLAEYAGLLAGILHLGSHSYLDNCEELKIMGDSELVIRQMSKQYQVRHPHLKLMYNTVYNLLKDKNVTYKHIGREQNTTADELANYAYTRYKECPYFHQTAIIDYSKLE